MAEAAAMPHHDLSRIDFARIRLQLIAMRAKLEARRSERDMLDLKRVEAALYRMARGVYGACESCARPVHKARLLAALHVRYCALCSDGELRTPSRSLDRLKLFA